jgi:methylmalonyl-CoA mutase N-terminal domain/subunit
VLAYESGVVNTVDPLGGSYFVEALTDRMEEDCYRYFRAIDELGGMVAAIKSAYPQSEIAEAAFSLQRSIDSGERIVVGVNAFEQDEAEPLPILRIDPELERKQVGRVQAVRARRDSRAVEEALGALREAAANPEQNLMEALLECARAHATEGEIVQSLQQVFGGYTETPAF